MTTKKKAPAKKGGRAAKAPAARAAKPAKAAKSLYRVCEATDGRQLIGDYPTADAAAQAARAYQQKHRVPVEVARGKVAGSSFQAEFTEVLAVEPAGTEVGSDNGEVAAIPDVASESVEQPAVAATDTVPAEPVVATAEPAAPKATARGSRKAKPAPADKPMSALDAAAQVLAQASAPMSAPELIGAMAAGGLWSSPNGKTPAATLSAAIGREIQVKGTASRFRKTGPGRFAIR